MTDETRSQLRSRLRRLRRSLSPEQQAKAATRLMRLLSSSGILARYRDIAFYLANDGEIDPALVLERAIRMGKRCYLPVLTPHRQLWFVRYLPGSKMTKNRFGIPEPQHQSKRAPWTMGLVLMPLVGFDRYGARLGMGGGFYDRSFSYVNRMPAMRRPCLVGLAHSCQEVERLSVESWDIPLRKIVTDKEVITIDQDRSPV